MPLSLPPRHREGLRVALYFNKLSFIRLLTIINHHKIEWEFQNCTGHRALG